jgi:hypothetical protein
MGSEDRKESPRTGEGVGRRELLGGLVTGLGAAAALPVLAEAPKPAAPAVADHAGHAPAGSAAASTVAAEPVFDAHQRETFAVLAERIVPGSASVKSVEFVESLLALEDRAVRSQFLSALGVIDAESRRRHARPFRALTPAEQDEVLTAASTGPRSLPDWRWRPDQPVPLMEAEDTEPAGAPFTLRDWFECVKAWAGVAFYSSEAGQRELGWTGRAFFAEFPGCPHPAGFHR